MWGDRDRDSGCVDVGTPTREEKVKNKEVMFFFYRFINLSESLLSNTSNHLPFFMKGDSQCFPPLIHSAHFDSNPISLPSILLRKNNTLFVLVAKDLFLGVCSALHHLLLVGEGVKQNTSGDSLRRVR